MTTHLQAALAFALTMMALATIVTVIMEMMSRLFRRRGRHLRHMLTLVYESDISPRISEATLSNDASSSFSTKMLADARFDAETWLRKTIEHGSRNVKSELTRTFASDPPLCKLLTNLAAQWDRDWRKEDKPPWFGSKKSSAEEQLKEVRLRFIEYKLRALPVDIDPLLGTWFSQNIALSPFQPQRYSWWANALSKLANVLGADASSELSREDFVRRLARSEVGQAIKEQAEGAVDTAIDQIVLRFDEVSDAAREYFANSSRVISVLVGISLAVVANIDGVRIYRDFIDDPAKAERFAGQTDEYKEVFAKAQEKFDSAVEAQKKFDSVVQTQKKFDSVVQTQKKESDQPASGVGAGDGPKAQEDPEKAREDLEKAREDLEKARSNMKEKLSDLTSQGISLGWKFSPHCHFIGSQTCEDNQLGYSGYIVWLISALITGVLIGLGGPFWYDVVTGLTRATQIMRGRSPRESPADDEEPAAAPLRRTAGEIFGTHVQVEGEESQEKTMLRKRLDRLKKKIEAATGTMLPPYTSVSAPPHALIWSRARIDEKNARAYRKSIQEIQRVVREASRILRFGAARSAGGRIMLGETKRLRVWSLMVFALIAFILGGCAGVRLYDQSKSDVATAIKTKYQAAELLGTIDIQRANLVALSTEELKVVRDNLRLHRDYALLEMVDNDEPMGLTWNEEIELPVEKLGFVDAVALRKYLQGEDIRINVRDRQLDLLGQRIQAATGLTPANCVPSVTLPTADELDWPTDIDQAKLDRAKDRYGKYIDACRKLLDEIVIIERGRLLRARKVWERAKDELVKREVDAAAAKELVKQASRDHATVLKQVALAGEKGAELRKAIKKSAEDLQDMLESAAKLAPDVVSSERISAIVTLLKAAAGEDTKLEGAKPKSGGNAKPNEELAMAVLLVNGISSLSSDVATLVATAEAPSVSNLLIELQHQSVLFEHSKALQTLQEERVDILETKYLAYREEAEVLLSFRDALCSFGHLSAGKSHPGPACDKFKMSEDGTICGVNGDALPNCGLTKPWKQHLETPPSGDVGREFYKALTTFNRLFPVRAAQIGQNFKLIDLKHRENLATREMGLKAWNNLAVVPIDQIEAYYKSGLKPAQIADVIVKALGFTAITVGVSQ